MMTKTWMLFQLIIYNFSEKAKSTSCDKLEHPNGFSDEETEYSKKKTKVKATSWFIFWY